MLNVLKFIIFLIFKDFRDYLNIYENFFLVQIIIFLSQLMLKYKMLLMFIYLLYVVFC